MGEEKWKHIEGQNQDEREGGKQKWQKTGEQGGKKRGIQQALDSFLPLHHLSLKAYPLLGPSRPFPLPDPYPPSLLSLLLLLFPFLLFRPFLPFSPLQPFSSLQPLGHQQNLLSFFLLFSILPPFQPPPLPPTSPSFLFLLPQPKPPSHTLNFLQKLLPPPILPNLPLHPPPLLRSLPQKPLLRPLFVCSNQSIHQD